MICDPLFRRPAACTAAATSTAQTGLVGVFSGPESPESDRAFVQPALQTVEYGALLHTYPAVMESGGDDGQPDVEVSPQILMCIGAIFILADMKYLWQALRIFGHRLTTQRSNRRGELLTVTADPARPHIFAHVKAGFPFHFSADALNQLSRRKKEAAFFGIKGPGTLEAPTCVVHTLSLQFYSMALFCCPGAWACTPKTNEI